MNTYQQRMNALEKAGFTMYCNTSNDAGSPGSILTNTDIKSPYNGECVDLFEDNSFHQYCQFKDQSPIFSIK